MPRVLVICIGNTLRSDDAFAWHVADQLNGAPTQNIRAIKVHQLTPELAEAVAGVDLVVFVDASAHGVPGVLTCDPVTTPEADLRFFHDITPATVIQMAKILYRHEANAFLICAAGTVFEHGESLSPALADAVPAAVAKIRELAGMDSSAA